MAIKTSGSLSMTEIVAEFGGSAPHSLSEYYGVASGIPTSGTIAYNQFYGASAQTTLTYPTGNYRRVNLADWVVSQGYSADGNFKITIDADTSFWSDDISLPALDASGLGSLHLVNNGRILGKGGNGFDAGAVGPNYIYTASALGVVGSGMTPAENGGPALSMCSGVVENNGYIGGGGGGGGGPLSPQAFVLGGGFPTPALPFLQAMAAGTAHGTSNYRMGHGLIQKGDRPSGAPTYIPATGSFYTTGGAITQYNSGTYISGDRIAFNGGGGGAGGGRGGRTGMHQYTSIGAAYGNYQTDYPPVPNAVGQTGGQAYRTLAGDATFQKGTNQGKFMVKPATPADAGGGGGGKHWSSAGNPYGSEIY